jgi:uronate dehydrogenase
MRPVTVDRDPPGEEVSRVLITGAAGQIGSMIRPRLAHPNRVLRLLDTAEMERAGEGERVELVRGSVTDMSVVERACRNVNAVIHLAGHSREMPWQEILEVNIGGTYTVFEAARRQSVPQVIFASSSHAVGYTPLESAEAPDFLCPRPDTNYGVGKVVGEAIGSMYADRYGMDVICIRIGACFNRPGYPRTLGRWLSPGDCARLLDACLTARSPGFRIIWGVSANSRRLFSLVEARRLGYEPRDDSEQFAGELAAEHGQPAPDDPALRYVGGDWFGPEYDTARGEHAREQPENEEN